jgi:multidrug resistance efflux pump
LLPVITLVVCSALTAWLWYHQAGGGHAVGAVEVLHAPVTSGAHGTLGYLPGKQLQVFDEVGEGDVVAVLDPGPFQARKAALQAELDDLRRQAKDAPGTDRAKTFQAMITSREQDLADVDSKLGGLQLRSPLTGTVTHVHLRPGQAVQPGEAILEVSAKKSAAIVAYLRQDQQQINPTMGMAVQVYLNRRPVQTVLGHVDTVGGQIESVPNRQLRDQRVPEWGLPVRVAVPQNVELRPGEVVTLDFRAAGAAPAR